MLVWKNAISVFFKLASKLGSESKFKKIKRVRYKKRQFQYKYKNKPMTSAKMKFEIEFLNTILDIALLFIKKRFEMLSEHADNILNLFLINNRTMSSIAFENQNIQICENLS